MSPTPPVMAIPNPSAKRNPLWPMGKVATPGNPAAAAGTAIIIAGTSVANTGALALLYSFTKAAVAPVFVAQKA